MHLELEEARRRFAAAPVARLATVAPDSRPHLVPTVFALEGNRIHSIVDTKPKDSTSLARLRNIEANPQVSLLVDEYSDDWERLWWVRADGRQWCSQMGQTGNGRSASLQRIVMRIDFQPRAT
jgi:PPOX class probable F420-dependent enzyme